MDLLIIAPSHGWSNLQIRLYREKGPPLGGFPFDFQIQTLRVELSLERQRRERLENRYTTRDEQVNQLRTTFDQSLNTISKDTKNIKTIIGKSLQVSIIQDFSAPLLLCGLKPPE